MRVRLGAPAIIALALCGQSGCMVREQRIERAPGPIRVQRGAPLAGSERVYALVVPRMDLLELRVRAEALCGVGSARRVERIQVDTNRAASGRYVGAAAAAIGGVILLSGKGADVQGGTLVAAGAGIVVIPLLAEGEERHRLPAEEQTLPGSPPVPCADRPVGNARVAVRIGARTLEGRSDVAGRVRFRDEKATSDMTVFVDDLAVPLSVGTPPAGAVPASDAPTDSAPRPDEP